MYYIDIIADSEKNDNEYEIDAKLTAREEDVDAVAVENKTKKFAD